MSTTYPSDHSDPKWACVQRYLAPPSGRGKLPGGLAYGGKELAGRCLQQGDGWDLGGVEREPGTCGFSTQLRKWVVERSFAWLIRSRRLATDKKDYERKVQTSETLNELAASREVLRRLSATAGTVWAHSGQHG